ncbi:hypothetical protein HDV57DRAFT_486767 [Trichoderma longibrachiatum]
MVFFRRCMYVTPSCSLPRLGNEYQGINGMAFKARLSSSPPSSCPTPRKGAIPMLVFRPSSATGSFPFAQAIGCPLALEWIWAICMYVDRSSRARLATDTFRCPCRLASSLISTLFVITPSLQAGAWYYRYSVRIVFPTSSVQGRVGKYTRPGFSPLPLSQVQSLLSPTTGYDTPVHRLWHKKDER